MDYNQLYQQYSGFTDPFGRRRDEEEEDAVGNVRPVTQTIRTDPVTGEQTMTIKGSPQDLSAANPLTPTVSMPGSTAGGFLGGYQDQAPAMAPPQAPALAMAPQMPAQQGGFLGGYEDMAPAPQMPAQQGGFLGGYQDMAPAPQMPPGAQSRIVPLDDSGAALQQAAPQQAAPQQARPVAPVAPVMTAPPQATPSAPVGAVAPTSQPPGDSQDYTQRMLAGLRQREGTYTTPASAASSAQGAYGITAPAYSDVQRSDPYFANRPQAQLSPEEQDRAALVLRGLNQQRLQSQGVEPTEANQQLAHFLGPKGAADYLASGYISPEAAAANGGVEKVRQIAEERLAFGRSLSGQGGPAVAGVGREMGMNEPGFGGGESPQATAFQSVQEDKQGLIKLLADPNLDAATRRVAETQLGNLYRQDQAQSRAEKAVADALTQKNGGLALDRIIKKEGSEGSYVKAYLFQRLGLTELAREEQQKLGAGDKWTSTIVDGKQAYIKFNAQGLPVAGIGESGDLSKDDLLKAANMKGTEINAGLFFDPTKPESDKFFVRRMPNGTAQFVSMTTGRVETDPKITGKLVQVSSQGSLPMQIEKAYGTSGARTQGAAAGEGYTPQPLPARPGSPYTGGAAPTGAAPPQAAPPQAAPTGAAPTGAAPTGAAQMGLPGANGVPPAVPTGAPVAGAGAVYEQKQNVAIRKEERDSFNKFANDDIVPKGQTGSELARIRRSQIDGPDGILKNPELAGLLQGQGGAATEVGNIIRDLVTGNYSNPDELSTRVSALSLNQRQKDVLYTQIGLQAQINPLTLKANSGAGAVSDAEQKANRDANVNILRQPLYSGLTLMTRNQFQSDLNAYRSAFKDGRPDLQTTSQFNSAWSAEKKRLDNAYDRIYAERAKYIAQYNKDGKNPGAVIDAYRHFPVPTYNSESRSWEYGGYSAKAARPPLSSF
jgi:hypothetical protein